MYGIRHVRTKMYQDTQTGTAVACTQEPRDRRQDQVDRKRRGTSNHRGSAAVIADTPFSSTHLPLESGLILVWAPPRQRLNIAGGVASVHDWPASAAASSSTARSAFASTIQA